MGPGRHGADPMTRAMVRLVVRTNIVLLAVVGLAYVVWGDEASGKVLGVVLCALAAVAWRTSRRLGA